MVGHQSGTFLAFFDTLEISESTAKIRAFRPYFDRSPLSISIARGHLETSKSTCSHSLSLDSSTSAATKRVSKSRKGWEICEFDRHARRWMRFKRYLAIIRNHITSSIRNSNWRVDGMGAWSEERRFQWFQSSNIRCGAVTLTSARTKLGSRLSPL